MCPPASSPPAADLGEFLTDELICKLLMQIKNGCSLPDNVLSDVDPYQYLPSNLPGTWYFWSGTKRDAEFGFWKSTGEACEVYSTPAVSGCRKTLEFYEGKAPHAQKTNWLMHKYTTTEKYIISKPDPRALYKVYFVDESTSAQLSKSQLLEKNMVDEGGPSAMANVEDDVSEGDFLELDDLAIPLPRTPDSAEREVGDYGPRGGDYLEMDDLAMPLSRTTSATDSSCMTMTSEEYFDSEALMRELGDDNGGQEEIQESKVQLNVSVSAKLKEVVMHTTTLVQGQTSQTGPSLQKEPGSSSSSSGGSSSSSKEEKKDRTKKRKVMKYLCFLAF